MRYSGRAVVALDHVDRERRVALVFRAPTVIDSLAIREVLRAVSLDVVAAPAYAAVAVVLFSPTGAASCESEDDEEFFCCS